MKGEDRKAAVAAYRERKIDSGIYAIRCPPSGQCWVGSAPNLATIQNRLWFTLRQGGNAPRSLKDAWAAHGEDAFVFEIVERLEDEEIGHVRDHRLKALLPRWMDALYAIRI